MSITATIIKNEAPAWRAGAETLGIGWIGIHGIQHFAGFKQA
jgi:hypothetical protein